MARSWLRMLSDDELKRVHNASLSILERTGVFIDHKGACEMLQAAGARVEWDKRRVHFPPELVEEKLKLVPRKLLYAGREPEFDFTIEAGGEIRGRHAGGAVNYVDLRTGAYRKITLDDWKEFVTLLDALPNVNALSTVAPSDVPQATSDIHCLRVTLEHQRKTAVHSAFSVRHLRFMIEMMLAVLGTKEALRRRPPVHHIVSPISPLYLNADDVAQLLLACEYGIPTDIPIMPSAGTTAPITIAGTLALVNAEFLGTMTLAQIASPGHPMPYFVDPIIADMRSGAPLMGAPEVGLLNAAIAQIGSELYGLPPEGIGLDCDSTTYEQTVFQKAVNVVTQALAGGRFLIGAGAIETCMAVSPVQLVIDDEIVAVARRLARGIVVSDDTLATEAIDRVGPRGNFLMDEHTMKYLRSGELMQTEMFHRDQHEAWVAKGAKNVEQRARDKALAILDKHEVPPLPASVHQELEKIVAEADRELAG